MLEVVLVINYWSLKYCILYRNRKLSINAGWKYLWFRVYKVTLFADHFSQSPCGLIWKYNNGFYFQKRVKVLKQYFQRCLNFKSIFSKTLILYYWESNLLTYMFENMTVKIMESIYLHLFFFLDISYYFCDVYR